MDEEEKNPFRKEGNPDTHFAKLWDKIHENSLLIKGNSQDIKWLKREYTIQIGLSVLTLIGLIITVASNIR